MFLEVTFFKIIWLGCKQVLTNSTLAYYAGICSTAIKSFMVHGPGKISILYGKNESNCQHPFSNRIKYCSIFWQKKQKFFYSLKNADWATFSSSFCDAMDETERYSTDIYGIYRNLWALTVQKYLLHRDHSIQKERANILCHDIACTRSFDMG